MQNLSKGANVAWTDDRVTVTVRCGRPVDVSALLLTEDRRVRSDADMIFYNQPKGPGVTYRPDGIEIVLAQLPADVTSVAITASLDDAGTFGAAGSITAQLVGPGGPQVEFVATGLGVETALVCVEVYRRAGAWKVRAVGQGYAEGLAGIATDFGITVDDAPSPAAPSPAAPSPAAAGPSTTSPSPSAAPPAAPVLPTAPPAAPASNRRAGRGLAPPPAPPGQLRPSGGAAPIPQPAGGFAPPTGRPVNLAPPASASTAPAPPPPVASPGTAGGPVNLDKGRVSLVKRQTVSLVKTGAPALRTVRMGLGWDPVGRGKDVDLDASVIAFDERGKDLDKIWYGNLTGLKGAVKHSGDNLTGEGDGDDEMITLALDQVPAEVRTLVFTVNSFTQQKFTEIKNAYCRLLDDRGSELVRYDLTEAEARTGVLMCLLRRQVDGTWSMTALGDFHDGRNVKKMVDPAREAVLRG